MMKKYLFLLGISIMWGSQFYFAEQVLDTVAPMTLAAIRSTIGACTLTLVALLLPRAPSASRPSLLYRRRYILYMAVALLEAVIPFFLVAWGQTRVSSSLASIVIGSTPLWTILIVWIVFRERLHRNQTLGVVSGFIGLMIIFAPDIGGAQTAIVSPDTVGLVALLLAAGSYAGALILMQYLPGESVICSMRNVLWIASVMLWPMVFMTDASEIMFHVADMPALLILGVFQTGLVYWLYNLLVHVEGPVFASFSNYLIPLVGIFLGSFLLNERLTVPMVVGVIVVIGSIIISRIPPHTLQTNNIQR